MSTERKNVKHPYAVSVDKACERLESHPEEVARRLRHQVYVLGRTTNCGCCTRSQPLLIKSLKLAADAVERQAEKDAEYRRLALELELTKAEKAILHDRIAELNTRRQRDRMEVVAEYARRLKLEAHTECTITGYTYQVISVDAIDAVAKGLQEGKSDESHS